MASVWHRCGRDCEITRAEIQATLKLKYRNQPLTPMGHPPAHMYSGQTPNRSNRDNKPFREMQKRDREITEANRRVKVLGPDMKIHWFYQRDWEQHGSELLKR